MEKKIVSISPRDLEKRLLAEEVELIDLRGGLEFAQEHIKGSRLIPLDKIASYDFSDTSGQAAVFLCRSGQRTLMASELLSLMPFKEIMILEGGLMAWIAAGLPTKKLTKAPIDIMRQVQVIAGSLVLTGILLGFVVHSGFLFIAAFVGAGLTLAGLTGFCGMARILAVMPWNRVSSG
ncbi:rhodanese-like domain-containing protein [Kiloniella laminariae]|uniref:rhodanese-like domain-containing protein n=1 Tax=Kiloniella laminariae TaxID=454162 RepID=UPI00035DD52E|nr:rhodanese family protein [Kiloniella laminariae]